MLYIILTDYHINLDMESCRDGGQWRKKSSLGIWTPRLLGGPVRAGDGAFPVKQYRTVLAGGAA
jgi:hypothetical protein